MIHKVALAVLATTALLLGGSTSASADARDDSFLQATRNAGSAQYFSSPDVEIREAHKVCASLRSGGDADAMAFNLGRNYSINDKRLEDSFIKASVDFYCPDAPHPQF